MTNWAGLGIPRDDNTKASIDVGKNAITESIKTIGEYIRLMNPLTTGLITAYFVILGFLGITSADKIETLSSAALTDPAIYMLISLIIFIVIAFPVPSKVDLRNLRSLSIHRNITLQIYRYKCSNGFLLIWDIPHDIRYTSDY